MTVDILFFRAMPFSVNTFKNICRSLKNSLSDNRLRTRTRSQTRYHI